MALVVDGEPRRVALEPGATLLDALRGPLGLAGPRFGCGASACGACVVLVDGQPVPSCDYGLELAAGRAVVTVAGLGTPESPHPVQRAFLAESAGQCGYCLSGILVRAADLVDRATERGEVLDAARVQAALDDHLCRCGGQPRMVRAVLRAAREARHEVAG